MSEIKLKNVDVFGTSKVTNPRGYDLKGFNPSSMGGSLSDLQIGEALRKTTLPEGIAAPSNKSKNSLDVSPLASAFEKANVIGGAISGLGGIASGIIGGRARREEQKAAQAAYQQSLADYKAFEFENAYADAENPFEDLRVSTEAAEFQAQQQQQGLAQTLDALRAGGGGAGAAALAQSLAQVQAQQTQRISADIARQEADIQQAIAQQAAVNQRLAAAGEMAVQGQEFERTGTILGMEQQRKAAADEARRQATASLVGGIGSLAGAALGGFGLPGGIGSIFKSTT